MPNIKPKAWLPTMCSVVITGMAATASLGTDADSIWHHIRDGQCGDGPMPAIESSVPTDATGGEARPLPTQYRPDLPRASRYLRWTTEQALLDAGLANSNIFPPTRRCAVLGTTLHGIRAGGHYLRTNDPADLRTFLAGSISDQALDGLNIQGGSITTCSACSSSLSAITLGITLLESHQVDVVIAGGYDTISEYAWGGFNSLRLIATDAVRPFCRERNGMKVAEGYGIVVLERFDTANDRGARIRANIAGWAESADSHHLTKPHPQGVGALAAIERSLQRAKLSTSDVDMIAAHATGTPDNDASEYAALAQMFGTDLRRIPVIGFKSFLGHTLGAAGAVELVLSCKAIEDQCVPAIPGVAANEVEYADLNLSVGKTKTARVRATLNMSLGFGGANECVILSNPTTPPHISSEQTRPITHACITGISMVLPNTFGHADFMSIMTPQDGESTPPVTGDINEEQLHSYIQTRRVRRMSLPVRLALAAAQMAIEDAEMCDHPNTLANACAILGSTHGSVQYCHDYYNQIVQQGALAANPVLFAEGVPSAASAHVSTTLGIKGSCQTIVGSMTAGLDALALAAMRISSGDADTVLVVASEESSLHVDRAYNEVPSNGLPGNRTDTEFASAAGSVAILLESPAAAALRGVDPYATVAETAWACSPSTKQGGPAASIASVLRRLPDPGPVFQSNHQSWMHRAELLGIRRADAFCGGCPAARYSGNLFSVAPLVNLASTLARVPQSPRCTLACADISGAATAVCIEHGTRRLA
jgi:3-oxoacyl-[acyl-carrier-protein] synthase II